MRQVNNKGFTIIEIIICFSFIMIISVSLFLIASNYKTRQQIESSKRSLLAYKNLLISDIQKDITQKGLKKIEACISSSNCYKVLFNSGDEKIIQKYSDEIVRYGEIDYKVKEEDITTIESITLTQNEHNLTVQGDSGKGVIYKLIISINHRELVDGYNIEIVSSAFKNS